MRWNECRWCGLPYPEHRYDCILAPLFGPDDPPEADPEQYDARDDDETNQRIGEMPLTNLARASIQQTRDEFAVELVKAEDWLRYRREALAYYDEWLADPNLEPPVREFPTYPSEAQS